MKIKTQEVPASGRRFSVDKNGKEVAHTYLYIMANGLHERPFGLMEDLFVDENYRGRGIAGSLINRVIDEARRQNCYKLICTSRHGNEIVHKLYEKKGFGKHGIEFRMNF